MQTYVIRRRGGWTSPEEVEHAGARSTRVAGLQMLEDVRRVRSYVVEEEDGSLGTVCVYQAESLEALREHARLADIPAGEILAVADTVVVRPDPVAVAA